MLQSVLGIRSVVVYVLNLINGAVSHFQFIRRMVRFGCANLEGRAKYICSAAAVAVGRVGGRVADGRTEGGTPTEEECAIVASIG